MNSVYPTTPNPAKVWITLNLSHFSLLSVFFLSFYSPVFWPMKAIKEIIGLKKEEYIPHLCCPRCAGGSEGAIQLMVSPERPFFCEWKKQPKKLAQDGTPCCLTQVLIWGDYKHSSVITGCRMWWHWLQWDEEMHVLQVDWKGVRSEKGSLYSI